jgi:hypothetical protein
MTDGTYLPVISRVLVQDVSTFVRYDGVHPGGRFGHSLTNTSLGVILVGGYESNDQPADPYLHILDGILRPFLLSL